MVKKEKEKCKICSKSNSAISKYINYFDVEYECINCGARYIIQNNKIIILSVDLVKDRELD